MARREINIFGISFLDLISGALGAFIIMFVIANNQKGAGSGSGGLAAADSASVKNENLSRKFEKEKNKSLEIIDSMKTINSSLRDSLRRESLKNNVNNMDSINKEKSEMLNQWLQKYKDVDKQRNELKQEKQGLEETKMKLEVNIEEKTNEINNMNARIVESNMLVVYASWNNDSIDIDLWCYHYENEEEIGIKKDTAKENGLWFYGRKIDKQYPNHILSRDDTLGPGTEIWNAKGLKKGYYVFYVSKYIYNYDKHISEMLKSQNVLVNLNYIYKGGVDTIKIYLGKDNSNDGNDEWIDKFNKEKNNGKIDTTKFVKFLVVKVDDRGNTEIVDKYGNNSLTNTNGKE